MAIWGWLVPVVLLASRLVHHLMTSTNLLDPSYTGNSGRRFVLFWTILGAPPRHLI